MTEKRIAKFICTTLVEPSIEWEIEEKVYNYKSFAVNKNIPRMLFATGFNNRVDYVDEITSKLSLQKKWSIPLKNSLVNVNKPSVSCEFVHMYQRNHWRKNSFFVQCEILQVLLEKNNSVSHVISIEV